MGFVASEWGGGATVRSGGVGAEGGRWRLSQIVRIELGGGKSGVERGWDDGEHDTKDGTRGSCLDCGGSEASAGEAFVCMTLDEGGTCVGSMVGGAGSNSGKVLRSYFTDRSEIGVCKPPRAEARVAGAPSTPDGMEMELRYMLEADCMAKGGEGRLGKGLSLRWWVRNLQRYLDSHTGSTCTPLRSEMVMTAARGL